MLAIECPILGHVLFPRNLEDVDVGLLLFPEQIAQDHTFIHALLADTTKDLCITKTTFSTYLESCISLLQI